MTIRLLLADDHRMLREGLRRSMEDAGFTVVAEAGNGEEAVTLCGLVRPDVVLMDVSMPVVDGVEATRRIHRDQPEVPVLVLSMHSADGVIADALRAGASGYLVKDCSTEDIAEAVRQASQCETHLSPAVAASMLDEVRRLDDGRNGDAVVSRRELEVLQLVADGCSTPEIAAQLFISQKTVKNHLASIYAKLDARDRTQAVLQAVRMGIVRLA
jgi:DNA-binding NarL/FixJ family response regulator